MPKRVQFRPTNQEGLQSSIGLVVDELDLLKADRPTTRAIVHSGQTVYAQPGDLIETEASSADVAVRLPDPGSCRGEEIILVVRTALFATKVTTARGTIHNSAIDLPAVGKQVYLSTGTDWW
jgi:hypothetical protein